MPKPGLRWRHVTIHALRSWLHGEGRGFRSRAHRIHSSGDYKDPPPIEEHEGLRRYHQARSGEPVHFPVQVRGIIGRAIARQFLEDGHRVLAVSVSGSHAHGLVELPDDIPSIHAIVGRAKNRASRAVRTMLPGAIWGEGGDFKPVDGYEHQVAAFDYICKKQGPGAWSWTFRDGPPPDDPTPPGKRKRKHRVRTPRKSPPQAGAQ